MTLECIQALPSRQGEVDKLSCAKVFLKWVCLVCLVWEAGARERRKGGARGAAAALKYANAYTYSGRQNPHPSDPSEGPVL
jgi:hypothetical protein